ncbi:MAG: hypothetical protein JNJ57_14200 [Saprospiraceae bacterium]|nr:hypothetical protein [Saprospiraceae bacterium]
MRLLSSALLLLALTFAACSNDDNSGNSNNPVPASGAWKISYFFDKQDKTGNYTSYSFEFLSNGAMSATGGGQTYNGAWLTGFDDSKNKFLIDFSGAVPSALQELEEDWLIIQMTDDSMHFEHTSGGNGDTDILKFSKN